MCSIIGRSMKIFIGLRDTASNESGLHQGFGEIGVKSVLCLLESNPYTRAKPSEKPPWIERLAADYRALEQTQLTTGFAKKRRQRAMLMCRWRMLFWAIGNCDTFILGYRSTFFGFRELPLLRLLRKRIIYVCYGSDARPPYLDGNWINEPAESAQRLVELTAETADALARIERWAHVVVNRPVHAQFMRKPFVDKEQIGRPCSVAGELLPDSGADGVTRDVRILHAPSASKCKGTEHIRGVIEALRAKGLRIEYSEITGQPNAAVLEAIKQSDIVVDQAYADIPLAGLSTEAAFFGRAALVGGYAKSIPTACPTELFVAPQDMGAAAERLIREPAYRASHAKSQHEFVMTNWTARAVAERFRQLAKGDIPAGWIVKPEGVRYLHGCGADESRVQQAVREVVKHAGKSALKLDHNATLRDALLRWAGA